MGWGRKGRPELRRALVVCLLWMLPRVAGGENVPAPPPECWEAPRDHPESENATGGVKQAEERMRIDHVSQALPEPTVVSPNGAYAYHLDSMPSGAASGATRAELLVFAERPISCGSSPTTCSTCSMITG